VEVARVRKEAVGNLLAGIEQYRETSDIAAIEKRCLLDGDVRYLACTMLQGEVNDFR
jgi:hypothetical protein